MSDEQQIAEARQVLELSGIPWWLIDLALKDFFTMFEPYERDGSIKQAHLLVNRYLKHRLRIKGEKPYKFHRSNYLTPAHYDDVVRYCESPRIAWAFDRLSYHRQRDHPDAHYAFSQEHQLEQHG